MYLVGVEIQSPWRQAYRALLHPYFDFCKGFTPHQSFPLSDARAGLLWIKLTNENGSKRKKK